MSDIQFSHLVELLSAGFVVVLFALGYIGGYSQ